MTCPDRCYLKGEQGDRLHDAVRLCTVADMSPNWQDALGTLLTRALNSSVQRSVGARI